MLECTLRPLIRTPPKGLDQYLEDTARYLGFILAPAEGFAHGLFCLLGKKIFCVMFLLILGHLWCSVVPIVRVITQSQIPLGTNKIKKIIFALFLPENPSNLRGKFKNS